VTKVSRAGHPNQELETVVMLLLTTDEKTNCVAMVIDGAI